MSIKMPSVLEVDAMSLKMLHIGRKNFPFPWEPRDREVLTILSHAVTVDVDDIIFKDDGSIWVKPGCWRDGSRSMPCGLLNCLDDRTSNNRYVREDGYHRFGRHPSDFLTKISNAAGCRAHAAERIDTARRLEIPSVDHLSYPFYYHVREQIALSSPQDDKYLLDASYYLPLTIPGLVLPELTGHDHPNRMVYAASSRYKVVRHLLDNQPNIYVSSLSEEMKNILQNQTNVFWWQGFEAEYFLINKLKRKGLLVHK